jgi:hypothetical protein
MDDGGGRTSARNDSSCRAWVFMHVYRTGGTSMKRLAKKWASLVVERVDEHSPSSAAGFDPDTTEFTLRDGTDPTPGKTLLDRVRASSRPERVYVEIHSAPPTRLNARRWRRSSFCTVRCCCVLQTLLRLPSDYVGSYIRGRGPDQLSDYAELPFPASPAPAAQSVIRAWQRQTADILLRGVNAHPASAAGSSANNSPDSAARRRMVRALANPLSRMVELQCALPPQLRRALPLCVEENATARAATSLDGGNGPSRHSRRSILAASETHALPPCRTPPSGRSSSRPHVPVEALAWACLFDVDPASFDPSTGAFGSVGNPILHVIGRTDALEAAYAAVMSALGDTGSAVLPATSSLQPQLRMARTHWPRALNTSQVEALNQLVAELAIETLRESANDEALFAAVFAPPRQPSGAETSLGGASHLGGARGMATLPSPADVAHSLSVRTAVRQEGGGICRREEQGTGRAVSKWSEF